MWADGPSAILRDRCGVKSNLPLTIGLKRGGGDLMRNASRSDGHRDLLHRTFRRGWGTDGGQDGRLNRPNRAAGSPHHEVMRASCAFHRIGAAANGYVSLTAGSEGDPTISHDVFTVFLCPCELQLRLRRCASGAELSNGLRFYKLREKLERSLAHS